MWMCEIMISELILESILEIERMRLFKTILAQ